MGDRAVGIIIGREVVLKTKGSAFVKERIDFLRSWERTSEAKRVGREDNLGQSLQIE